MALTHANALERLDVGETTRYKMKKLSNKKGDHINTRGTILIETLEMWPH
jgi:hypothetical protein